MAVYLVNGIPVEISKIKFITRIDDITILIKTKKDKYKVSFDSKEEADENWEYLVSRAGTSKAWIVFFILGNIAGGIVGQFLYHWLKPYLF